MEKLGIVDQVVGANMLSRNTGSQLASEIEDKIQLSILKGDFDNLKNHGKPIHKYENPLVDRTTDLAFEILKKNGIKPEWIELQNIVYSLKEDLIARLRIEWCKFVRNTNNNTNNDNNNDNDIKQPSANDVTIFHSNMANAYANDEAIINKKNDEYNRIGINYYHPCSHHRYHHYHHYHHQFRHIS